MDRARQIVFGPYRLDTQTERLWQGDQVLALRPRSLAVLRHLAEHPGQIISGRTLIEQVWSGTHVTDTVLRVCIREIREALHDTLAAPSYIETVRRQGYRFLQEAITTEPLAIFAEGWTSPQPVVGRQAEFAYLQDYLHRSIQGNRCVVLISGATGVGKTALVDRLLSYTAHLAHTAPLGNIRIGRGQCVEQYRPGEAYLPVLEALGRLCREPGGDAIITILRRYAPTWLLQMPSLVSAAERDHLQHQIQRGVQDRMLREMSEAIDALTAETPLVLVLEDLHWSDTATLGLVALLAQQRSPAHLLLIGTYRPEETTLRPHPLKRLTQELHGRGLCSVLSLPLLTQSDVAAYVTEHLQGPVSDDLVALIYRRTEGNALFMVNVLDHLFHNHYLVQRDDQWTLRPDVNTVAMAISEELRQLITKRLDYLRENEQRVLEAASVNGTEFSVAAVAAGLSQEMEAVENVCDTLAGKGALIEEIGVAEWPDHTICGRYRFQHTLYQQVIYERISASRRIHYHRRIGQRLETGYPFQSGAIATELAQHFTEARDLHRALTYRCQAGKQALSRHAYQEAGMHGIAALDLLKRIPEIPKRSHHALTVHLMLGAVLAATRSEITPATASDYQRLREQCWEASDLTLLCPAVYSLWNQYLLHGECQTAHDLAAQLMQRTQSNPDPTGRAIAHQAYGCTAYWQGSLVPARQYLEESVALYPPRPATPLTPLYGADTQLITLAHLALVLWHLGYADQARTTSQQALHLSANTASASGQTSVLILTAVLHHLCRDLPAVQTHLNDAWEIATDRAFPLWIAWHKALHGWVLTQQQQGEAGRIQIEDALSDLSTTGALLGRPYMLALLAEAHRQLGQISAGLSVLDEATTIMRTTGEFVVEPYLNYTRANLLMQRGNVADWQQAEVNLQQTIDTARGQTATAWELRASLVLSRLWQKQAQSNPAQPALKAVYQRFTEGFDTADLREAKALIDNDTTA